jgi:quinol monooxygenase YgiN
MAAIWYVKITAKEGEEETVWDGLQRLVAPARSVDGCEIFEVHREVEDPRRFSIYEVWRDHAAHDVHAASDHFRDIAKAVVIDHSEPMESIELEVV